VTSPAFCPGRDRRDPSPLPRQDATPTPGADLSRLDLLASPQRRELAALGARVRFSNDATLLGVGSARAYPRVSNFGLAVTWGSGRVADFIGSVSPVSDCPGCLGIVT